MSQLFAWSDQSVGTLASASVLPMNIQDWFSLGLVGFISLLSKGLSRVFSSTTVWEHQFFGTHFYGPTLTSIRDYWKKHSFDYIGPLSAKWCLCFLILYRFVIAFLPRSKYLLISWLQSPSAVILSPKKIKSLTAFNVSPSICHEVMGPAAMIFVFWMLSFTSAFSLSSFDFFKRFFILLHFLP